MKNIIVKKSLLQASYLSLLVSFLFTVVLSFMHQDTLKDILNLYEHSAIMIISLVLLFMLIRKMRFKR